MIKINFQKLIGENIPVDMQQPHRSQIYVGYQCHQQCGFCYYKDHFHEKMFSKENVLKQIDVELAYGITDFEITGGEPSECDDLAFYCQYIKDKLPNSKIAIITNGGLWKCNYDVWKNIDEVLVSYHISKRCTNIDKTMFPRGDTYDKVFKTIQTASSLGKLIRTNTIIGTFNVNSLNMIVDDLLAFRPNIINFLPINLFDDAKNMEQYIDYDILRPILKAQIDRIEVALPDSMVFVRYMPFCKMEGYEKHIIGTLQHMYDWFDWNPELCGDYLLDYIKKFNTIPEILAYLGKYGSRSIERSYDCINTHYEKDEACLKCKYYIICDGVEKTKDHRLLKQISPTPGKMVKNPMKFIGSSISNYYKMTYRDN